MKKLFILAAAAITFAACSNDTDKTESATNQSNIRLMTSVANVTRSTSQTLQATQIENGQSVLVELSYDGTANDADWAAENKVTENFTADGAGVLNGPTIKYPVTVAEPGKVVTAKAWAPCSTTTAPITWTVQADQTTDANYIASDFLYGVTESGYTYTNVVTDGDAVVIKFAHKLSKINVNISSATDENGDPIDPTGASIVFGPASLNLSGDVSNGNVTATTTTKGAVTMTSSLETAKTASAVIIPQTIANANAMLTITLGTSVYKYSAPAAGKTFDAGKVYTYTVSLRGDGSIVILNEVISDWQTGETETIVATKE